MEPELIDIVDGVREGIGSGLRAGLPPVVVVEEEIEKTRRSEL